MNNNNSNNSCNSGSGNNSGNNGNRSVDKLLSIGEEITTPNELNNLFASTSPYFSPIAYDGFEPSGRMHIAQGLLKTLYVKKMVDAGCTVVFWIADWFAQLNDKMGGDLAKIQCVGKYMIEIWGACGMPIDGGKVKFLWASDEINKKSELYWTLVMDICSTFNISRLKRCTKILGRNECSDEVEKMLKITREMRSKMKSEMNNTPITPITPNTPITPLDTKDVLQAFDDYEAALEKVQNETMPTAYLLYAAMQCADIYFLGASVCQLGMDQKKVNMLAREYHDKLFDKKNPKKIIPYRPKPIIISHHMIMGLKEGQEKMSKSDPDSAIFMEDTEAEVNSKIKKSFCRPKEVNGNPVLDYYKHIIFPYVEMEKGVVSINKGLQYGGEKSYVDYTVFEKDYIDGVLHPSDIKPVLAKEINRLLSPVRQHFQSNSEAKALLEQVKKFKITK